MISYSTLSNFRTGFCIMASMASKPEPKTPSLKKSSSSQSQPQSSKNQKSILGFFQKTATQPSPAISQANSKPIDSGPLPRKKLVQRSPNGPTQILTPAPSSDAIDEDVEDEDVRLPLKSRRVNGPAAPMTPSDSTKGSKGSLSDDVSAMEFSSPTRKVQSQDRGSILRLLMCIHRQKRSLVTLNRTTRTMANRSHLVCRAEPRTDD